jgi:hypothetical protein
VKPHYKRGVDANQAEIVAALRAAGLEVHDLSSVGSGFPDILVSSSSEIWLMEIKIPGGKLNKEQEEFHATWRGKPIFIVRSVSDAFRIVGIKYANDTKAA